MRYVSDGELWRELSEMAAILPDGRLSISCVGIDGTVLDERIIQFCAYCRKLLPMV